MSPRYVAGKVLGTILTLAFVLAFNFFLFRVVEDDPVNAHYRGRNLTPTQKAELADRFGVDDPMPQQFANYVRETAQLNLGYSFKSARPVADEIRDSLWPTIWLVGVRASTCRCRSRATSRPSSSPWKTRSKCRSPSSWPTPSWPSRSSA